jgi:hypothetical protein
MYAEEIKLETYPNDKRNQHVRTRINENDRQDYMPFLHVTNPRAQ